MSAPPLAPGALRDYLQARIGLLVAGEVGPAQSPAEARSVVWQLLEGVSGLGRSYWRLREHLPPPHPAPPWWLAFEAGLVRLAAGEPLQYVMGWVEFEDLRLTTDPRALIPRPETAQLSRLAREHLPARPPALVVDWCTGSGCLALAHKRHRPADTVWAFDVSAPALALAAENGEALGLPVHFAQGDLLTISTQWPVSGTAPDPGTVSLILSNPPYVPASERPELEARVRDHEPGLALFVPDEDPILFYKALAVWAHHWLAPGGQLLAEGHIDTLDHVARAWEAAGLTAVAVLEDFTGRPRFAHARQP